LVALEDQVDLDDEDDSSFSKPPAQSPPSSKSAKHKIALDIDASDEIGKAKATVPKAPLLHKNDIIRSQANFEFIDEEEADEEEEEEEEERKEESSMNIDEDVPLLPRAKQVSLPPDAMDVDEIVDDEELHEGSTNPKQSNSSQRKEEIVIDIEEEHEGDDDEEGIEVDRVPLKDRSHSPFNSPIRDDDSDHTTRKKLAKRAADERGGSQGVAMQGIPNAQSLGPYPSFHSQEADVSLPSYSLRNRGKSAKEVEGATSIKEEVKAIRSSKSPYSVSVSFSCSLFSRIWCQ